MPQLGIGGCAPIPKKLNPASNNIADAKLDAAITITGPIIFGRIYPHQSIILLHSWKWFSVAQFILICKFEVQFKSLNL